MIPLADKRFFESVSLLIKEKLAQAAETSDLVDITGMYGIGTSYTLVSFAKERGWGVVVGSNDAAAKLRAELNYPAVFSVYDLPDKGKAGPVLIDTGIARIFVEQQGLTVVTGYYRKEARRS